MGDMSKCSHGGHRGYCDLCNPIEADLRKELSQAEARVLALETALRGLVALCETLDTALGGALPIMDEEFDGPLNAAKEVIAGQGQGPSPPEVVVREKIAGLIDMIDNCAGVDRASDNLPMMVLAELRALLNAARQGG